MFIFSPPIFFMTFSLLSQSHILKNKKKNNNFLDLNKNLRNYEIDQVFFHVLHCDPFTFNFDYLL
jgi:hypothetical protein